MTHESARRTPVAPFMVAALLAGALGAGCAESNPAPAPSAAPPARSAPAAAPSGPTTTAPPASLPATSRPGDGDGRVQGAPADPTLAVFAGLRAPKPVTWIWQPPQNAMRAANYVLPAPGEGNQAHLVVFQGIGGSPEANISRWVGQFRAPDGGPIDPEVSTLEVNGLAITMVELAGEYMRTGAQWYTKDQLFLGAVFEGPQGAVQIVLTGDQATVEAHRDAFLALIRGLQPVGDA